MSENKFENIQVGDTVYIREEINTGWNRGRSFWMPKKVTRLTPTMFELDDVKYRKSNGRKVTSDYGGGSAYRLGDSVNAVDKCVTDQTDEYKAFKSHVLNVQHTRKLFEKLQSRITFDIKCVDIFNNLKEIEADIDAQTEGN